MEYKLNKKSTTSLEGLKEQYIKESQEKHNKFLREHSFKSFEEILDYLKTGNAIGSYGEYFEYNPEKDCIIAHMQHMGEDDCYFWFQDDEWSIEDFEKYVNQNDDYHNEEGYYKNIASSSI